MSLKNVTPGDKAPEAFNVVIEIPMHGDPIKYEVDKQSGALFVDRELVCGLDEAGHVAPICAIIRREGLHELGT